MKDPLNKSTLKSRHNRFEDNNKIQKLLNYSIM